MIHFRLNNEEAGTVMKHRAMEADTIKTRENQKILKSMGHLNLCSMKNLFAKTIGIAAIFALSFTSYAQTPCPTTNPPYTVSFGVCCGGLAVAGLPANVCMEYSLNCCLVGTTPTISGTVTFRDCNGGTAVQYSIVATASGIPYGNFANWTFNFVSQWGTVPMIGHDVTVTDGSNTNETTFTLTVAMIQDLFADLSFNPPCIGQIPVPPIPPIVK